MRLLPVSIVILISLLVSDCFPGGKKQRYNILFIIADDLRPELGCYGAEQIYSPNIDQLARESLVFEHAYCNYPICNPSRMSFLTGLRPHETGITINDLPLREKQPDIVTLPQHFRIHGYQAEAYGKVFHQGCGDSASWDFYNDNPPQRTYQLYKNTSINVIGDKKRRGRPYEDADVPDSLYSGGIIANRALKALRNFNTEKHFFIAVGFLKPQLPFIAPRKYWDLYEDPAKSYIRDRRKPGGHPPYAFTNSGELRKYHSVPKDGPIPSSLEDTLLHGYFACVSYMDAQVGRLLRELKSLEYDDNTIVVLFGDHGYQLDEFDEWCKATHYELSTRTPLIIHHPDMNPARTNNLTELIDLFPTLVEAADLESPTHPLSGKSLYPLFSNPGLNLKRAVYTGRNSGGFLGYSMRTDQYRLVKWLDGTNRDSCVFLELYDYNLGIQENQNMAYNVEYDETRRKLLSYMKEDIGK